MPAEQQSLMSAAHAKSHFVTASDGLKLHVREWACARWRGLPVFCLPGLSRTVADFELLADALAADTRMPRRVLALDSRGRGRSEYDRNPANYNLRVELADLLDILTALGIARAVFVGTSRGGLLTMLLAAARPCAIAGCVLNDIGPVIEPEGLARIRSYVGKLPAAASFEDGAEILRQLFGAQFPRLSKQDWLSYARRSFKQDGSRILPDHDSKLAVTLQGIDLAQPLPSMWPEFDALARTPLMLIHGSNSDVLSTATVAAMRARRANMEVIEVADQGHAPLLTDRETMEHIAQFAARCDETASLSV
jgi:pimeloyl-ACP methyl ester carboxylesterase